MHTISRRGGWIAAALVALLIAGAFAIAGPSQAFAADDLEAADSSLAFETQKTSRGFTYTLRAKNGSDITMQLRQALRMGKSAEGCYPTTIKIPAGKFKIDSKLGWLQIFSNTTLELNKNTVITLAGSNDRCRENMIMLQGAHFDPKTGKKCSHEDGKCTHGGYSQLSNITIKGGTWDGNCQKHPDWNVGGILLRHGQKITLKNVNMRNFTNHAINISGTKNDVVDGCTFTNSVWFRGHSFRFWGAKQRTKQGIKDRIRSTESLHLDFCNLAGESTSYPLDGTPCQDIKITNCKFNKTYGGIGTHHANKLKMNKISVSNCKFSLKDGTALNFFTCAGATVKNCTVTGGDSLLRANKAKVNISNCKATKCDGSVIGIVNSSKVKAINNTIDAIGDSGVWVATKSAASIKGNKIKGAKKCLPINIHEGRATISKNKVEGGELSISLREPTGACKIVGNTVNNSTDNAIYVFESTKGKVTVKKNKVNKAESAGVRVNKSKDVDVLSNTVVDAHYGISVDATSNMNISKNQGHGGKTVIRIDGGSTGINVVDNVLKPDGKDKLCSNDAITFDGKSKGSVKNNTIVRPGDSGIDIDRSCSVSKKGNKVSK